ncbi:alpha/beta hydrolase [Neorhodopirellula pilleata]|uniref:alpha/beta hydrolase n=1 Tax=Neorhodopirellula pilleata TaxID=2714738 RepID=UPI0018CEABA2|nr:alpha/beta hydrolase [Neorhodopirellula pilleata]
MDKALVAFTIVVSLFATNAFAIEVPKRVQKKILAAAPEIDLNRDGEVTAEELISSREKLPENMRVMLDLYLGTQGDSPKESEPVKHTTTLPKPPDSNGTTPFLDPIFEYQEIENITYCTAKSGDTTMPLLLDIYRPVASPQLPTKLPAMILAFGGGWRKGSKDVKYIRDLCGYYAQRGYVAISIQYRIEKDNPPALPGPAPNPEGNDQFRLINAAFQDTCDAVRWVRANASSYNIDPKRIGIGGVSAGAFNALHTAFSDDEITGPDAKVAAVISLMGAIVASHIDENDPPVFIAHGTRDNVAPYAMVKNMVQQLEKVNAEYSFYPVDGVAHRLQTILEAEFDGKSVADHSLGFCFEAMKLGELIKESR